MGGVVRGRGPAMSGYDTDVLDLAESFLRDYDVTPPENYHAVADRIAQRIQQGIEDDLEDLEAEGKIRDKVRPLSAPGIERNEQKR